jgi:Fibronectin type III domain
VGLASAAGAAGRIQLLLSQSAAFSIIGRSCGGIQEKVYSTGFAANGYPAGDVYMQTSCGGSGRGGGYKSTTYSAWAAVTWDRFGDTRGYARLEAAAEGIGIEATDAYGDRIYNEGPAAYLETTSPPLVAPAAPTGVTAVFSPIEVGEELVLRFQVSWTPAPETAGLITSSTVTATPVSSPAPVVTATTNGGTSSVVLAPLQPHTTYEIAVTNTDREGTSQAGGPTEAYSEGVKPPPPAVETCELDQGTITLSPGLEEAPHVQSITIKGQLKGCDGSGAMTEGTYVAHLRTTEEVTCSELTSIFAEPNTTPASVVVKWLPPEAGKSTGALVVPLTEVPGMALSGTLQGGGFEKPLTVSASSLSESFTGGPTCGVPAKKGAKAKPVKKGTFATSQLEIGV